MDTATPALVQVNRVEHSRTAIRNQVRTTVDFAGIASFWESSLDWQGTQEVSAELRRVGRLKQHAAGELIPRAAVGE